MPELEVIRRRPARLRSGAPLLFVHGAYTGAWCWDEYFLPFFAERGFDALALSLRGHGASAGGGRLDDASLDDYLADVAAVAETLDSAPIIVGHSMGGAVAQRYVQACGAAALILLASVPPHGLWGPAFELWWQDPALLLELALVQSGRMRVASPERLRCALFAPDTPAVQAYAYLGRMQKESDRALMDLSWLHLHALPRQLQIPLLIAGGEHDGLFGPDVIRMTAAWYGTEAAILPGLGHTMMLDRRWDSAARHILQWLEVEAGQDRHV